jgi:hypothetical protein
VADREPEEPAGAAGAVDPVTGFRQRANGYYLYGVTRARSWPVPRLTPRNQRAELVHLGFRDLEALVRLVPFETPPFDEEHLQAHQRVLDGAMRQGNILPLPYGVVFRGRRAVIRFLEDQYLVLDEALAFFEGHWEMRVHVTPTATGDPEPELFDLTTHFYSELRRFAKAAVPFPRERRRLLSAGFLVGRDAWVDFMERCGELGDAHPEVTFDITGPWPPYDFVRLGS